MGKSRDAGTAEDLRRRDVSGWWVWVLEPDCGWPIPTSVAGCQVPDHPHPSPHPAPAAWVLQDSRTSHWQGASVHTLLFMLEMKRIILASWVCIIKTEEQNLPINLSPMKMHGTLLKYDSLLHR